MVLGLKFYKEMSMSVTVRELSGLALGLPTRSRAILADLLLDSLDEGSLDSCEEAWLDLAAKRDTEMESGAAQSKSHADIMEGAREAVRCAG